MDDKSSSDSNNNEALRLANNGSNHGNSSNHHHHHHQPTSTTTAHNNNNNNNNSATLSTKKLDSAFALVPSSTENGGHSEDGDTFSDDNRSNSNDDHHDNGENPNTEFPEAGQARHSFNEKTSCIKRGRHERFVNQCNLCGKKCLKQSEFKRHLVYHLGKKPFKCTDCGKRFQVKSNMLLHQRAAHGDRYNHEFLECPPGVLATSSQSEMPVLCAETSDSMYTTSQGGGGGGGENSPGSPFNKSVMSPSSSRASGGDVSATDRLVDEDYNLEYPSVFPGLKHQLQVRNETVLVTRLDGLNKTTKERLSLFKCHMCGKIFNFLSKLQCHLSTHFERTLNVFVCTYCDAHFQFKTQLTQHLRRSHEVDVTSKEDILDMTELDGSSSPPATNPDPSHALISSGGAKNSGSPAGGSTSGLSIAGMIPTSPSRDETGDERVHYHTEALYSRVNGLYICQFCNKGFDRLFSLSRHERVHTGFKPCYCKYCGRGFSEPRNLRHHIIRFHSESGDAVKRFRKGLPYSRSPWRVNRRVSHSSQRLAYVPPELVNSENSRKDNNNKENSPKQSSETQNRSDSESPLTADNSQRDSASQHQQQLQPIVIQPTGEVATSSASKQLANEIREKEKLDEDVTVVIPSDVPIDESNKEPDRNTPRSVCSDNTNWSEGISESETDAQSIMSAPIKSLMGHHVQLKSRRKMSFTATTPTPGDDRQPTMASTPGDEDGLVTDIKPKLELGDVATSSTDNPLHSAVSAALSLPFNPLNISTYMTPGLGGLLPSPLISPLNQAAFFAQQGLTSPSMVPNPLSFFPPLPNPSAVPPPPPPPPPPPTSLVPTSIATATTPTPTKDANSPLDTKAHSPTTPDSSAARGSLDDLQSWMSKGGSRGSALSRSHSSRLYVVRQPVKREEACKPVVLPDGRTVYRCTYCNKDFCTFSDVNRHMDFHEGGFSLRDRRHGSRSTPDSPAFLQDIRPYKCKFCDYYARTNSQLKVHMMRHQGIREFHCKLCNYKGVTQSDLNRHMKSQIHMMKAQNECKHCGEGFVSPKNLERHYHEKHFSQYEKMATSHAAAAAAAAAAAHAGKLGQGPGFQGNA